MPRSMEIQTPLGDDVLLFHRLHAREELSRSSDFQLELLSAQKEPINFDEILGKNVTVRVKLQDDSIRHFNGFVTRFAAGGRMGRYLRFTATVSPWAWFMTRTADCRIFQDKTVREILEEVFADHPMADFKFELMESYEKWTYCVQYRETDFNFVSRLMEHEGIYYYYRHIDGAHTMVLTDSIDKHEPFPGYDCIKFIRPQELVRPEIEHISSWDFAREVQPGVFALDDYDFERPAVDLRLNRPVPRKYTPSDYEWFEYPGFFTKKKHGEQLAQVRGEEFGSQFERGFGESNARGIHVGSVFQLENYSRDDQNCKHLVVSTEHDLEYSDYEAMPEPSGSDYRCKFVAMTTAQQFRPKRLTPKPFVQGPRTVGRGNLHRQIWPREGSVPLGFAGEERRAELVLDSRVAPVGGEGVGLRGYAADRSGSDRRFSRRRSGSADHHGACLQRRQPAPLWISGGCGHQRDQVGHAQRGRLQRDVVRRHRRHGEDHDPRPVRHEHDRGARPDIDDPQLSDGRSRCR
jgi:type VI secretion system secreted protein VgrG